MIENLLEHKILGNRVKTNATALLVTWCVRYVLKKECVQFCANEKHMKQIWAQENV